MAFSLSGTRFATWDEWARAVRPTKQNHRQWKKIRDRISRALRNPETRPFSVKEVLAYGSTSKGTAIKNRQEVDMVVIINNFQSENMKVYKEKLKKWAKEREGVDAQVYQDCVRLGYEMQVGEGEWSSITVDLSLAGDSSAGKNKQVEFVRRQNPLCKDVIRMAKDWRDRQDWGETEKYRTIPKSFLIELMVIQLGLIELLLL
jgi:DNA polymerase sigma